VAERDDLLDRSLLVKLSPIPEAERLPEKVLWERFRAAKAAILGGLLNAASQALARRDSIPPLNLPRMADFAIWVMAGEEALGLQPGDFMRAYTENRKEAVEEALDASPIYHPLTKLLADKGLWEGTASELLEILNQKATDTERKHYGWPKTASKLGKTLRRNAPALRSHGWNVEWAREGKGRQRTIKIEKVGNPIPSDDQPRTGGGQDGGQQADSAGQMPATPQAVAHKELMPAADMADRADGTLAKLLPFDMAGPPTPSANAHKADGQAGDFLGELPDDVSDLFEEYTPDKEWRSL
jgi:hypothetical protein